MDTVTVDHMHSRQIPADANTYVVTLARNAHPAGAANGRAQVVSRGKAISEAFRSHLQQYVAESDRSDELVRLGGPTSFGMVSIVSTEALADAIRHFPEVESVIEDRPFGAIAR